MGGAQMLGNDQLADRTPARLVRRPAEHRLGGRVEREHAAVLADDDDAVQGRGDDRRLDRLEIGCAKHA